MIKLIASDLDGTLLCGRDTVSEEMFELVREMNRRGILFVVASGRQYGVLKKIFEPVWEEMAFISENGCAVFYKDQMIAQQVIPKEQLLELIYMVDEDPKTEVALSSATTTYIRPKTDAYHNMLKEAGNHICVLKEWADVTEPCVKMAWYEEAGVDARLDYWKSRVEPPAMVVTSGAQWLDILYPDGNKGVGIRVLMEKFGIAQEETVAFGDNFNDKEMLEAVEYPFAMESGKEGIKEICPYHTDNVEKIIRKILDGEFPSVSKDAE